MRYVKILSKETNSNGSYGILEGEFIYLIKSSPIYDLPEKTGIKIPVKEVEKFLPPVTPPNIIALGLNYVEHAKESSIDLPTAPVIFLKSTTALTGHKENIFLPKEAPDFVDYEAELVVVIGKKAKYVPETEISNYIFGYTCGNDVSARDCQRRLDKQWARGKSFDTFAPLGPYLVTDIEPNNLRIRSRLNGKIMQDSYTSELIFSIPYLISYLSRQMTLLPETVIMTGTPSGVGFARTPAVYLREGDTIEVEIENIGLLENKVKLER